MPLVLKLHSALRYLVLLGGLAALVYFGVGLATRRAPGRGLRALGAAFTGLLDLQVAVGLLLVLTGIYYPALIGHIVLMLLAAGAAHGLMVANRKRAAPGWALPFAGVALALALIVGGILAIGRSVVGATAFGG